MPRAPKKCGRPVCETRVTARTYCPVHEAEQRELSTWGRGSTRQSRREREQALAACPTCYLDYEGCTIIATEDDHIIPLSQGGSNDIANHAGACTHCHAIKSKHEAATSHRKRTG